MASKVVITGATGFVGRSLAEGLLARGVTVIGVTRRPSQAYTGPLWWEEPVDAKTLSQKLKDGGVDAVLHVAGRINGSAEELRRDNLLLTQKWGEAVAALEKQPKFIYVSTVSATEQLGPYGCIKHECEKWLRQSGVQDGVLLRPSLLYGPHDTKNVANLVRWVKRSPLIPVPGMSSVKLQPLWVLDIVPVVLALLKTKGPEPWPVYVLSGPRQEKLSDMIRVIQKTLGKKNLLVPVPLAPLQWAGRLAGRLFPNGRIPLQQVSTLHDHPAWDTSRAERELGFRPCLFEEGMKKAIAP
jgi:nucleoside-diphosphate-sugar epimerase